MAERIAKLLQANSFTGPEPVEKAKALDMASAFVKDKALLNEGSARHQLLSGSMRHSSRTP
jgi:hypothetical protein